MKSVFKLIVLIISLVTVIQTNGENRPNIIVILADDLGYNDLGFTGSKDIFTPQLDKLAANGMVFTNGYVTHPYCGPSRAGLLTGRYQARFGMEINPSYSPFDLHMGLPLEETTFAKRLQDVGYRTGIIGKWHMGAAPPFHPNNRGFDYFYGFLSGGHSYFPKNVNTLIPLINPKNDLPHYSANEGGFRPLVRNNGAGEFPEYLTTALSRDAAEFIRESDKPFLLYLAYNAPHAPLEAPKETIDKYKHIENKYRRTYAAMIDKMDEGIGMVVESLRETGKLKNTIIFFLSDNGGVRKESHGIPVYASNYPFRKGKGSMYEGGCHVPFIVHWPAGITKPQKFDGLVSALDIAATAIAVSGADKTQAKLDGVNLVPYLKDEKQGSPNKALFWRRHEGEAWAVRTPETKFLRENQKSDPEIYDMKTDPYESTNIINSNPEIREEMARLWNTWNKSNENVIWLQANSYQKKRLEMYEKLHDEMKEKAAKRPQLIIE